MGMTTKGSIDLTCNGCKREQSIQFDLDLKLFGAVMQTITKSGWIILGENGEAMCSSCHGLDQEDVERTGFKFDLTTKDWS